MKSRAPGESPWLVWARRIQAIGQTGLAFATSRYDRRRYATLHALSVEMMAELIGGDPTQIEGAFRDLSGYATPKVDVRGAIFQDDRVLLVREAEGDGGWSLPGGWAEVDQSPTECVVNEIREEAGLAVAVRKLAAVYHRRRHPHPAYPHDVYRLFFICEITGGTARPDGLETTEVRFFCEHALPPLSTSRILDYQIRRMFEHKRTPHLPTDCD